MAPSHRPGHDELHVIWTTPDHIRNGVITPVKKYMCENASTSVNCVLKYAMNAQKKNRDEHTDKHY